MKQYLITAMLVITGFTAMKAQGINEILEKHVAAMGGQENWDRVKTIRMAGVLNIQGNEVRLTTTSDPGRAMKWESEFGGYINHEAMIGNSSWVRTLDWPKKIDSVKVEVTNATWPQFDLKTNLLVNYKTCNARMEYAGEDHVNETPCYKIKYTDRYGFEFTHFIDKASYFLVRTECVINEKDEEKEVAVAYGNYSKTPEGVMIPASIMTIRGQMDFKKIEINVPVNDSTFMPAPPETR